MSSPRRLFGWRNWYDTCSESACLSGVLVVRISGKEHILGMVAHVPHLQVEALELVELPGGRWVQVDH